MHSFGVPLRARDDAQRARHAFTRRYRRRACCELASRLSAVVAGARRARPARCAGVGRRPLGGRQYLGGITEHSAARGAAGVLGSYLHDAMRSRGLDVEVPGQLGNLNGPGFDFGWSPAQLAEPTNRESSIEEIARVIGEAQECLPPFTMSARLRGDDRTGGSLSVGSPATSSGSALLPTSGGLRVPSRTSTTHRPLRRDSCPLRSRRRACR